MPGDGYKNELERYPFAKDARLFPYYGTCDLTVPNEHKPLYSQGVIAKASSSLAGGSRDDATAEAKPDGTTPSDRGVLSSVIRKLGY